MRISSQTCALLLCIGVGIAWFGVEAIAYTGPPPGHPPAMAVALGRVGEPLPHGVPWRPANGAMHARVRMRMRALEGAAR